MKKILIFAALIAVSCGGPGEGEFVLKGKIGDWSAPAKVYLSYMGETEMDDSTDMDNGRFSFEGRVPGPSQARLIVDYTGEGMIKAYQNGNFMLLYVEEGVIKLNSPDSLANVVITGSPVNDQNREYLEYIGGSIIDLNAGMNRKFATATPEEQADPQFGARLNEEYRSLLNQRSVRQQEYARRNPSSYMSIIALNESVVGDMDVDTVEPIYNGLDQKVRDTEEGRRFAQRINAAKTIAIGQPAPGFTQDDADGNPVSLSDFLGTYVLLDFWASWCGPCRAESPYLVRARERFGDRGFDVLGVSMDKASDRDKWLKAMEDDGYTWTNVCDLKGWDNEAGRLYGIRAIPQNFLIDPSGIIIAQNLRGENLLEHLEELFAANK